MEHGRDEQAEEVLGDIILAGGDILSYLNDNDGLEEQGEEAGYGDRRVEEERHDYDGSGDPMLVQEGARGDGSGDEARRESCARMKGLRSQQSRATANRLNPSGQRKHLLLSAGF